MLYQTKNSLGQNYFECIHYPDFFYATHMHRHPELIYVENGEVEIQTDGRKEIIRAGEFAMILPNRVHAYSTPQHSSVYVLVFSEDYVPLFTKTVQGKRAEQARFLCRPSVAAFVSQELLLTDRMPDVFVIKSALYAVIWEYTEQVTFTDVVGKNNGLLDRIIAYVHENYEDDISLQTMAEALGYERHYLSRYFHNFISMHFSQYVNWFRVDMATELLRYTDMSITEIALKSGFQSIRSFNRVYLQLTGTTPTMIAKHHTVLKHPQHAPEDAAKVRKEKEDAEQN